MGIFKKILGICDTKTPADPNSWNVSGQRLSIDLARTPELGIIDGAVRLEGKSLSNRIFVIRDKSDAFYAFENKCTHMGRRLDPGDLPGSVKCCSVFGSEFDLSGKPLGGPAKGSIKTFPVEIINNHLEIDLGQSSPNTY